MWIQQVFSHFISPLKKYVYIKYISIFMSLLFDMCKSIFKSRDNIFKKFQLVFYVDILQSCCNLHLYLHCLIAAMPLLCQWVRFSVELQRNPPKIYPLNPQIPSKFKPSKEKSHNNLWRNSDKLFSTFFSSWKPPGAKMEMGSYLDGTKEYFTDAIVIH